MINNIYSQYIKQNLNEWKKSNPIHALPEMIKMNPFLFKAALATILTKTIICFENW